MFQPFIIFHIFNDILKVSCLGSITGIVEDVERPEKALLPFLGNSAFIHPQGKADVMHIKSIFTQASCPGYKVYVFFCNIHLKAYV